MDEQEKRTLINAYTSQNERELQGGFPKSLCTVNEDKVKVDEKEVNVVVGDCGREDER